jgi:preprotein translocase subunit Sec61beta
MAQDKINMPSSTAGITRYFDDYKSKIEFKPGHIIILCLVVIALSLLLHAYGNSILGLQ